MCKMNTDRCLRVTEIQRFCMHDGPGIRTTVFLKGCPLSCTWCHNPETQSYGPELTYDAKCCIGCGQCGACPYGVHTFMPNHQLKRTLCVSCGLCEAHCPTQALAISGKAYSLSELLDVVLRDRPFYGLEGGVTLSGGEPLAQGENVIEFLRRCKEEGISTAVETCGYVNPVLLAQVIPFVDLFLWDVKDMHLERHREYTGVSNTPILDNLKYADRLGAKTRLRCILVNGINSTEHHYSQDGAFVQNLAHCDGVDILPYHGYGGGKCILLGKPDNGRMEWIPNRNQIDCFVHTLESFNISVRCL